MNRALRDLLKLRITSHRARRAAELETLEKRGEEPGPGDIYALADLPAGVEWVVLEPARLTGSSAAGPLVVVVPADGNPLVGVGDVEVTPASPGGP